MLDLMRSVNPTKADCDEWVELPDGKVAHRYNILTTTYVCYAVYEPSSLMGNHSTITSTEKHGWLGDITTRRLPPELDALPGWRPGYWPEDRIAQVTAWQREQDAEAEAIIRAIWPKDFEEAA